VSEVTADVRPCVGKGFRLQWEPAQDAHVLLYPEGMVKLNRTAAAILSRCDGRRTVVEIVADLETTYGTTGLEKDVMAFLATALTRSWLEIAR
jgi:pyrroloquinoline quinone biosynthesis protein D